MARSPEDIVADIERRQNKEDLELPSRAAKAVSKLAGKKAPEGSTFTPENPAPGMKKGGKIMEHKHNVEHVKHHYESAGHKHEQDKVAQHKESHKMHHEHVKAMHKGGKSC